ncbi:MAG TPA: AAA family ATPase, partial [Candidatus Binatia bacterium]
TLARALARRLGAAVVNSDVVRKGLAGASDRRNNVAYGKGIYNPSMTGRAYRRMTEEVERHLAVGEGVIVDATFQKAAQRSAVFEAAARNGAPLAIVYCHTRDGVVRERLFRRAEGGRDISDGTWRIYLKQREVFEPFAESAPYHALNTGAPVGELCGEVEQFLRAAFSTREKPTLSYPVQQPAAHLLSASR